ncbi:mRNA cap guanine-N7 methyltransferase-like protein [Zopfochytrium polystomum]|nr:mRNA cap guanine-N7 methyltransferase-like protein [Zopfochytrium polystomum]
MSAAAAAPSQVVANHYNARPQIGREQRKESVIYHLKNLNNWTKSVLISKFVRSGDRVLDFCCGKGGDLQKWRQGNVASLVGVDIASVSIEHSKQRFSEGSFRFTADFFAADCFAVRLADRLPPASFDLVSCQFALHYCAESREKTMRALQNVATMLKPGGVFIGTVPNAYRIVKKLQTAPDLSFGNSIYKITFDDKSSFPMYGHRYMFELADAIDNCPEYLLNFRNLVRIAELFELELVYRKAFHDLFVEESASEEHRALLYRMNVLDRNGTISPDEWEASGIYMAFAFRKKLS